MRWVLVLLVFAAGIGVGMYVSQPQSNERGEAEVPLIDVSVPQPVPQDHPLANGDYARLVELTRRDFHQFTIAIARLDSADQIRAIRVWNEITGGSFASMMRLAELLVDSDFARSAIDVLLDSAAQVGSVDEKAQFEAMLAIAVDRESRKLMMRNDGFAYLDRLLERITLALPELPIYFLRLGTLRVQAGNEDGALAVLAQIQNHPDLGPTARALLEDVEAGRKQIATGIETLPLQKRGDQFIVDAVLDGGRTVSLLIDTGASMTVISRRRLESLGYAIDGPTAYFATAGGVVEGPVVTVPTLALGRASVRQLSVGVLPIDFPGNIDGLLGMNFLRHFEFRIDQDGAQLRLDPPRN